MPITVAWGNREQNIIHLTLEGTWAWNEYDTAANAISVLLSGANSSVDLVIDFRSDHVPDNAVKHIEEGYLFFWHPRMRFTILVGVKGFIRTLLIRFVQTYPGRVQQFLFAGTLENAHILLAKRSKQRLATLQLFSPLSINSILLN